MLILKEKYIDNKIVNHVFSISLVLMLLAFLVATLVIFLVSVTYKQRLRKIKTVILYPLMGLGIISIPFIEDYINLIYHGQITHFFGMYLSKDNTLAKIFIYILGIGFLFRSNQIIKAMSPIVFLVVMMSIFVQQDNLVVYTTVEYIIAASSVLLFAIVSKSRYTFINFIDSLLFAILTIGSIIAIRIATAGNLTEISNLRAKTFTFFSINEGLAVQAISWVALVIVFLFAYLMLSTMLVYKVNYKKALSIISLEKKYRSANIDFQLEQEEISLLALLHTQDEGFEIPSELIFITPEEPKEEKVLKLRKVFIKSKGIRSPSF